MKNESFKVGDRVKVYDARMGAKSGEIILCGDGMANVKVQFKDHAGAWFHPKQCRRLKKRERRRVWIQRIAENFPLSATNFKLDQRVLLHEPKPGWEDYIEFIEVKK